MAKKTKKSQRERADKPKSAVEQVTENLKAARSRCGLTAQEAAKKAAITSRRWEQLESGQGPEMKANEIIAICRALGVAKARKKSLPKQRLPFLDFYDYDGAHIVSYRPEDTRDKRHIFPQMWPSKRGFGKRLRQARMAAGLSLSQASKLLNLESKWLRLWEGMDDCEWGSDGEIFGIEIAQAFGVGLDWLEYGDASLAQIRRELDKRRKVIGIG
jgi:transcriptional regulator with XRE-family HTH domain